RFTIEFERASKGIPRVGVQFEIDANGILHVLARDIKTGNEKIVEMKSAVDVSDADVQKMVEESVEHAFDDLRMRQWTEAKLRAVETATATRKGLAECGGEIDPGVGGEIQKALDDLENVLASEDAVSQTGDARRLKSALSSLDAATGPLAEHMMDKAMEAMLRKRGLIT
ncbi:MAG: molecular chaperone DnaK, partial [Verrucomicrobiales bacterium]|nr:molecular chaperone DnaK [Verrucomicrobiales bacterium]